MSRSDYIFLNTQHRLRYSKIRYLLPIYFSPCLFIFLRVLCVLCIRRTPALILARWFLFSFNSLVVKCQALGSCNAKENEHQDDDDLKQEWQKWWKHGQKQKAKAMAYMETELKVATQFVMHDEGVCVTLSGCVCMV